MNLEIDSPFTRELAVSHFAGIAQRAEDTALLSKKIPNYRQLLSNPDRVYLLEHSDLWPVFKVVGAYGKPGRSRRYQLFIAGLDRHTKQPFALGIPDGFIKFSVEVCLRWTMNAHKGDQVIEV